MKDSPTLHQLGALVAQQMNPEDIPQADWPMIIAEALRHSLAPMLLWVIKQQAPELVTEPLWTPVIATTRNTGIRYIVLETARKQVSAALEGAQIPALWIKGIALAHTLYSQPVLRSMGDLDVLVPFDQREQALKVLEDLGYHFYQVNSQLLSSKEALHLNLTHHYNLRGGLNDSVVVELHFRLLSTDNELLPLERLNWFWTQTTVIQNGSHFTIPRPEAHLLYLCAHAILQHGEEETFLRHYFDLHQLVVNTTVNWDQIVEQATTWEWGYAVGRALSLAVQYFSTPVPDYVLVELQKKRTAQPGALTERAIRIQGRGARWEQLWMKLKRMSFADRVDMIRRVLFPPRSYMRIRYDLRSDQIVWFAYLYRWLDQSQDVGWAVWKRLVMVLRRKA